MIREDFYDLCMNRFRSEKPLADHETVIQYYLEQMAEEYTNSSLFCRSMERMIEDIVLKISEDREYLNLFIQRQFLKIEIKKTDLMINDFMQRLFRLDRLYKLLSGKSGEKSDMICRYLARHVDEDISIGQMAEYLYMNKKYLSSYIIKHLGMKYSAYQRLIKMERAKKLLSDHNLMVYEVADRLGYQDVEYFSRIFKHETGQMPSEYEWDPEDDCHKNKEIRRSSDEILIGVIGAYTGEYAYLDGGKRYIYEMAVNEINKTGGIAGKPVSVIYKDYESDLSRIEKIMEELYSERVDVVVGGYLSSAREIIRKFIDKNKMLYLYDSLYEGGIADHYTFVFSSMPEQNLQPVIKYLFDRGSRRFYILATDYNYGILSCECAKQFVTEIGGEVVTAEYVPNSKSDFSVTIENIMVHSPDVVVTFLVGERQSEFFAQWHEQGNKDIKLINTSAVSQAYMHLTTEDGILENLYFSAPYTEELETEESEKWFESVRRNYTKEQIPYLGCDHEAAYLSLLYYKAAVEYANRTETEAVIRALESGKIQIKAPGGCSAMNPKDHHLIRDVGIYRVNEKNKVELLERIPEVRSGFVETMIEGQYGIRGGLKELGRRSPNIQYNHLLHKI